MTKRASLVTELWKFMRTHRVWWLAPILIVMLLLAGLVVLGSTGAAPFIYSVF